MLISIIDQYADRESHFSEGGVNPYHQPTSSEQSSQGYYHDRSMVELKKEVKERTGTRHISVKTFDKSLCGSSLCVRPWLGTLVSSTTNGNKPSLWDSESSKNIIFLLRESGQWGLNAPKVGSFFNKPRTEFAGKYMPLANKSYNVHVSAGAYRFATEDLDRFLGLSEF